MVNWGEIYYDHFEYFLKSPIKRNVFRQDEQNPSIQILGYDGVFPQCRAFCSLGLSHYLNQLKKTAEVCLVAEEAWDDCPEIIANMLFYLIQHNYKIGWGIAIKGIEYINSRFVSNYGKTAIYFTNPYPFPEEFSTISAPNTLKKGYVYWGVFISEEEYNFFKKFGAESFESKIEESEIDPFSLVRPSCIS